MSQLGNRRWGVILCLEAENKKKASAGYVDRSGRARKKYPRDGLEIFWNHTNIHRKYRIDSAIFILLPPPQFPPFNILIDVT